MKKLQDYIKDEFNGDLALFAKRQNTTVARAKEWLSKDALVENDKLYFSKRYLNKVEGSEKTQEIDIYIEGDFNHIEVDGDRIDFYDKVERYSIFIRSDWYVSALSNRGEHDGAFHIWDEDDCRVDLHANTNKHGKITSITAKSESGRSVNIPELYKRDMSEATITKYMKSSKKPLLI